MSETQPPLSNRVALITGVSRRVGIGYAIARRLGVLGARLFIHGWPDYDRSQSWGGDEEGTSTLAGDLRREGFEVEFKVADFIDPQKPSLVVEGAVRAYGHLDIMVANHAYSTLQTLEQMTAADIDNHLLVNVRGTLLLVQAFAAQHDNRPGGRVIMMTSGQHLGPMESELAYAASKGAIHQLTSSLSATLISRGITVNTINPGPTDTGYASASERQAVLADLPLGRWGEPDDAGRLIAWLCTDDAQWITGEVINSEGGFRRGPS